MLHYASVSSRNEIQYLLYSCTEILFLTIFCSVPNAFKKFIKMYDVFSLSVRKLSELYRFSD